jgi:uncharacterized membrane protein
VTALLLALSLGFVSGLRTFTPVAAVMLVRGGIWGIVLAVAAVGEYVVDVLPNTPSRTQAMGLSARVVSGAFVGWMIATMHDGSGMFGAIVGIAGAVIGAYAGHAARLAAIARIGPYPAAIVEDLVAIGLATFIVTRQDPIARASRPHRLSPAARFFRAAFLALSGGTRRGACKRKGY